MLAQPLLSQHLLSQYLLADTLLAQTVEPALTDTLRQVVLTETIEMRRQAALSQVSERVVPKPGVSHVHLVVLEEVLGASSQGRLRGGASS